MMFTKSKVAMLLVSALGALFVSHKHQKDSPAQVHTLSAVTITGSPARDAKTTEPKPETNATAKEAKDEPCVCPPPPPAATDYGLR